jgi:branched-subunit amino acid aminotransferase/4-amino-4-deoxychorismate lyase
MKEPQAFLNGRMIPAAELSVPVYDAGFVQGTTVAEQLRTFGGKLFRLDDHLRRLARSLELIGLKTGCSIEQLAAAAEELAAHNHALLPAGHDLGLAILVSPGDYKPFAPAEAPSGPRVMMHTYPLHFALWAAKFERGERLSTVDVWQVPNECWPAELKCRSRMHYYLADRAAHAKEPASRAILQDAGGFVVEASTANVLGYRAATGLVSPPEEKILPGISMAALFDLARSLDVPTSCRDISPAELAACDEVLLTSTSVCVLPVVAIDGRTIGSGQPGPLYRRLLAAWSEHVGLDIAAQARQFA